MVPQGVNLSGGTGAKHDRDRNGFGIQSQQLQQGPAVVVAGPLVIEDDQVGRKPLDLVVVVVVVGEERDGVTRVLQQVVDDEEDRWVRVDDEDVRCVIESKGPPFARSTNRTDPARKTLPTTGRRWIGWTYTCPAGIGADATRQGVTTPQRSRRRCCKNATSHGFAWDPRGTPRTGHLRNPAA